MTGYGAGYGPFARPYFAAVLLVNSYNYSSSLWLFHYRITLVDHLDCCAPYTPYVGSAIGSKDQPAGRRTNDILDRLL